MSLTVFTGPMFSGKTTSMLQEISRYTDISEKHKSLIINHNIDNRNLNTVISSHSSFYKGLSNKIDIVSTDDLSKVNVDKYVVIGIDEANFFTGLKNTIEKWIELGKHIICAGLDGSYKIEKFGEISDLLHLSDKFIKLTAICSVCLEELIKNKITITPYNTTPAPFTKKINIRKENNNVIDVGGAEKYVAVCRKHHK